MAQGSPKGSKFKRPPRNLTNIHQHATYNSNNAKMSRPERDVEHSSSTVLERRVYGSVAEHGVKHIITVRYIVS